MTVPISARLSQSLSVQSNVSYELLAKTVAAGSESHSVPVQLAFFDRDLVCRLDRKSVV